MCCVRTLKISICASLRYLDMVWYPSKVFMTSHTVLNMIYKYYVIMLNKHGQIVYVLCLS